MEKQIREISLEEKLIIESLQEKLQNLRKKKQLFISFESSTTVTNEPEGETLKSKAILSQMADGKESTSPLMPVFLVKNKTMVNLGPILKGETSIADSLLKGKKAICEPSPMDESQASLTTNDSGKDLTTLSEVNELILTHFDQKLEEIRKAIVG